MKNNHLNSKIRRAILFFDTKISFFSKHALFTLAILGTIGFVIRLFYLEPDIPLRKDSFDNFLYASNIISLGHLPHGWSPANNGWPIFLSIFFKLANFNNAISYMQLQLLLSIIISVLTIIPLYLLCKKFVGTQYSIIGSSMFVFEPRIIQNSLIGITEPLYILLVVSSLVLITSKKTVFVLLSFGICSSAVIVRTEAILLFFVISVLFLINNKKEKFVLIKYFIALLIFVSILIPNMMYKLDVIGNDGLIDRIMNSVENYDKTASYYEGQSKGSVVTALLTGFENYSKFLLWITIPVFILFLPTGVYVLFKKLNINNMIIILFIILMSIPAFYAYSYPHLDTRYLYVIYPMFSIISLFTIKLFVDKSEAKNMILFIILVGVISSSIIFLSIKEEESDMEAFLIAKDVVDFAKGIDTSSKVSSYINQVEVIQKWPLSFPSDESKFIYSVSRFPVSNYNTLEDFLIILKNKQLTHLVLDGAEDAPKFLNDIFYHEERYPYLVKIYDSFERGYNYHVKIYEIDYSKFELGYNTKNYLIQN